MTDALTDADLAALKAAATAALPDTPGLSFGPTRYSMTPATVETKGKALVWTDDGDSVAEVNGNIGLGIGADELARHFAEADPATVLRLIGEAEEQRVKAEEMRSLIQDAWFQFAYESGKGYRYAGGLSTLEDIEAFLFGDGKCNERRRDDDLFPPVKVQVTDGDGEVC